MTDKDIAFIKALSAVMAAVSAVHVEAVAMKAEGMSQDQLLDHVDQASKAVSAMFDQFNAMIAVMKDEPHA